MKTIINYYKQKESIPNLSPAEIVTKFAELKNDNISLSDYFSLIDIFGDLCWQLEDEKQQQECFSYIEEDLTKFLPQEKMGLIEKLINNSINYPRFVLLAEEIFKTLAKADKEKLDIQPIHWTSSDDYTAISSKEYHWRKSRNLKCWPISHGYARPMSALDLMCYSASIDMMIKSKSKNILFIG